MYTLGQAAKATGLSKSWLSKAISSGKISAQKQENGSFQIDPSELHRVFPPMATATVESVNDERMETQETVNDNSTLKRELEVMHEERQREREQLQTTIVDLRSRLDITEAARQREAEAREQAAADLRRLTLLITHQPQETSEKPPAAPPMVRPILLGAFALVVIATAVWWFWIK